MVASALGMTLALYLVRVMCYFTTTKPETSVECQQIATDSWNSYFLLNGQMSAYGGNQCHPSLSIALFHASSG
jgi:hypothetical protein